MAYQLNEKLRSMTPYTPITEAYAIRADANESFIEIPAHLRSEMAQAIRSLPLNRYPDPYAAEVVEPFAAFHRIDPALLTAGNGSDELISVITGCFLERGDAVAVSLPDFSMYQFYAEVFGNRVVNIERGEDLSLDADRIIQKVRQEGAKMLIFSNPCNPVSTSLPREEVRKIITSLDGVLVVLDEAYMDFGDQSLLDEVQQYDNLIILRTCSKALGAAGIRLGFAAANTVLTNALRAAKSPYNLDVLTQMVGGILLRDQAFLRDANRRIIQSREDLYRRLLPLEGQLFEKVYPTTTNFVFIKTPRAGEIAAALRERGISIRCFDGYLRITACAPEDNCEIEKQLKALCEEVKR